MAKFHVSADGNPHRCFAQIRPCPLGGPDSHYESEAEARSAYEASMADRTFPTEGKKGYAITTLMQVEEREGGNGTYQKLRVKEGFSTPEEAIKWAEENISDATHLITVVNDDWTGPKVSEDGKSILASGPGEFHTLNLVDISPERQVLNTHDVPTIAKFYFEKCGPQITDVHKLRLYTAGAAQILTPEELGRVRGYLKAATYGKR